MTANDEDVTDEVEEAVFERVRDCMNCLVGGSGHLSSYTLDRDTFEITETDDIGDGRIRYAFRVAGSLLSEFAQYPEETLTGAIVLDEEYELTFDERGRVRLSPYTVVHPRFWGVLPCSSAPSEAGTADWDPPSEAGGSEIPEVLASGFNPTRWSAASHDDVAVEVERFLDERGEVVVLLDREDDGSDDVDFEAAMIDISNEIDADHDLTVVDEYLERTRAVFQRPVEDEP